MRPKRLLIAVLLAVSCGPNQAQVDSTAGVGTAADPFLSAAGRLSFQAVQLSPPPAGFTLGSVQLLGEPPEALLATYYSEGGDALYLLESEPEESDCPECPSIVIEGRNVPYEVMQEGGDNKVVSMSLIRGSTGVSLALQSGAARPVSEMLDVLKRAAAALTPLTAVPGSGAATGSPLKAAAEAARFPVYAPQWLPQYFLLKTATYSPGGPSGGAGAESPATIPGTGEAAGVPPEQVILTYGDSQKVLTVLIEAPRTSGLPSGRQARPVRIGSWKAVTWTDAGGTSIIIDTRDALVCLSGSVQNDTLLKVARSLKKMDGAGSAR